MQLKGRIAVVTGGCSGIGAGLARRFLLEGAKAVVVADLRLDGAPAGTLAHRCDVSREDEVAALVARVLRDHERIDLFCSNAGVLTPGWDLREADFSLWQRDWNVNVMAHAYAAKAALPGMIARGEGYLLQTLSAASLLATPESASYTTTKHAALGLAESLAFTYARFGIRVSALCPMAVRTPMVDDLDAGGASAGLDGVISVEDVAAAAVEGLRDERFLIFPHPMVRDYYAKKAAHHDKWLQRMAALQERFTDARR
uniref:Oxidoreductase n=1 Tax=bacterium enrichment culture TaxID=207831 RepID=A0A0R7N6X4_9BACT|nr:oxidoreductase [bacterium enrichment culture]